MLSGRCATNEILVYYITPFSLSQEKTTKIIDCEYILTSVFLLKLP